jgi:SAM-dependent methyltransferase
MGIDASLACQIARTTKVHGLSGSVCTLGVLTKRDDDKDLQAAIQSEGLELVQSSDPFLAMGYSSIESIDVSDYEGCTHVFDLNASSVPAVLAQRYDVIFNGGTIEHVFDIRAALRNIFDMLKPGGVVIHFTPVNGWVDHGFYQISPTLLSDYYYENSFEILDAQLVNYSPSFISDFTTTIYPYEPGTLDGLKAGSFSGAWLAYFVVRKGPLATRDKVPLQGRYAVLHDKEFDGDRGGKSVFDPYLIIAGLRREQEIIRQKISWREGEGFELVAHIPEFEVFSDSCPNVHSPLLLFENGRRIGPAHTLHEKIRTKGGGRFSHWGAFIHFSTSDRLPPNDRVYEIGIPEGQMKRIKKGGSDQVSLKCGCTEIVRYGDFFGFFRQYVGSKRCR